MNWWADLTLSVKNGLTVLYLFVAFVIVPLLMATVLK